MGMLRVGLTRLLVVNSGLLHECFRDHLLRWRDLHFYLGVRDYYYKATKAKAA